MSTTAGVTTCTSPGILPWSTSGTSAGGASAEPTCMRVAMATCTVGTARATGRNTPGAGPGPASAVLLPSTNSRIRPERWASSASATSIEDSLPTDSAPPTDPAEDFTAAESAVASTVAVVSTAAVGTGAEATGEKCSGRTPMNLWRPLIVAVALLVEADMGFSSSRRLPRRFGITVVLGLALHLLSFVHDLPGAWAQSSQAATEPKRPA